jgi:hypothetical protein
VQSNDSIIIDDGFDPAKVSNNYTSHPETSKYRQFGALTEISAKASPEKWVTTM